MTLLWGRTSHKGHPRWHLSTRSFSILWHTQQLCTQFSDVIHGLRLPYLFFGRCCTQMHWKPRVFMRYTTEPHSTVPTVTPRLAMWLQCNFTFQNLPIILTNLWAVDRNEIIYCYSLIMHFHLCYYTIWSHWVIKWVYIGNFYLQSITMTP